MHGQGQSNTLASSTRSMIVDMDEIPDLGIPATLGDIDRTSPVSLEALTDIARAIDERIDVIHTQVSQLPSSIDCTIALPVRNEAARLGPVLHALARTVLASQRDAVVVAAVNDSSDGSARIIREFAAHAILPVVIVEAQFGSIGNGAPVARRLAMDIGSRLAPSAPLLTTDADTIVPREWLSTYLEAFERGWHLVCEDIELDDRELARLDPRVSEIGTVERAYQVTCERLWTAWTGNERSADPVRASGASMGIAGPAYRLVGGLPTPECGEDRALLQRCRAAGLQTHALPNIGTRSSARLDSRAKGGCGETLRYRHSEPNPLCDDTLLPLDTLRALVPLAKALPGRASLDTCRDEASLPDREPMRLDELRANLARAERELSNLETAP